MVHIPKIKTKESYRSKGFSRFARSRGGVARSVEPEIGSGVIGQGERSPGGRGPGGRVLGVIGSSGRGPGAVGQSGRGSAGNGPGGKSSGVKGSRRSRGGFSRSDGPPSDSVKKKSKGGRRLKPGGRLEQSQKEERNWEKKW